MNVSETKETLEARIEEVQRSIGRICTYCANGIEAKWEASYGRIHKGLDEPGGKRVWLPFYHCKAQNEHRRLTELQRQLDALADPVE
jgi:hypothetical protein